MSAHSAVSANGGSPMLLLIFHHWKSMTIFVHKAFPSPSYFLRIDPQRWDDGVKEYENLQCSDYVLTNGFQKCVHLHGHRQGLMCPFYHLACTKCSHLVKYLLIWSWENSIVF